MKIVIDDQYQNDENKQYTIDENGNINLFVSVGDEHENRENINLNNNIESNRDEYISESNLGEVNEEENSKEPYIEEVVSNCGDTINNDNPWKEEKYSRNYNNIYAEIENNLQEKYSNKNQVDVDNYNKKNKVKSSEGKGTIYVYSKLGAKEGIELKGARINLYLLNGVSPKLYDSKLSDETGKVSFNNLPNGSYRIIAIVDRRFFEKPIYYNWNEVTVDRNNKEASVVVVNKIKSRYCKK